MQQRTRRLSFNEEVLVAEYVKGSSGISQARATVPLVEMERRAKQRRAEEAAELQQHALLQAWVQLANQKPKSFLKPVAHASSRGGASAAAIMETRARPGLRRRRDCDFFRGLARAGLASRH